MLSSGTFVINYYARRAQLVNIPSFYLSISLPLCFLLSSAA